MREIKKKIASFPIVLILILIFFTTIMLLSIPVLFNYKSIEKEIEKTFYNDFKINLTILGDIKYNFFPRPHLSIEQSRLNLDKKKEKLNDIETKNLKIFIPLSNIYSKSSTEIQEIEIINTNFNFMLDDVIEFRNHLYYKINKPIIITNSKFFYLDKKGEVTIISPIEKLNYFIDKKNDYKQLKAKGNIFDTDYISSWRRYYDTPKISKNEITLKNPNLNIENLLTNISKQDFNYNGNLLINFLDENINFDYSINKDKINIKSTDYKNQKIKINSKIELNPFYFDSNIAFIKKDFEFIIDNILKYLLDLDKEFLGNVSGKLNLDLKNIENEIIDSGKIKLIINEKSIKILESFFEIKNVGIIKSNYSFEENLGEIIFKSNNILEISNQNEFAKKFQLNVNKIQKIKKIYFNLQKNIDTDEVLISNININKIDSSKKTKEAQIINNFQVLKSFLAESLY